MAENNEYKEVENELLPAIADSSIVAISEEAEKRLEAILKIKRIALKATNPHDWVDQNGNPYLQSSGSEKVARIFGISWRIDEPSLEHLEGGHYIYTYTGVFSLAGTSITATGTRSSKDSFFKKYRYEGKGDEQRKIELPPSEIDKGDVKKSAYSNLLVNGIQRLLGIRNLTYDDLKEFANITRDQITSVEYKKAGKPASKGQPTQTQPKVQNHGDPSTAAQVNAIQTMLDKSGVTDELAQCEKAQKALHLNETPTSIAKLTKGLASTLIGMLQQEVNSGNGNGEDKEEGKTQLL